MRQHEIVVNTFDPAVNRGTVRVNLQDRRAFYVTPVIRDIISRRLITVGGTSIYRHPEAGPFLMMEIMKGRELHLKLTEDGARKLEAFEKDYQQKRT